MKDIQVKEYLGKLTNKQLVEFLDTVLNERRCDEGLESSYLQAHWCLAQASRMKDDDDVNWEQWEVELLSLHGPNEYEKGWHDDSPICQFCECGTKQIGWAKRIICPVCANEVYAT